MPLPPRNRKNEEGQVLVLFAFAFVALIALGALLFTGAQGVAMRRQLQNTADAAALAAANLLVEHKGCSTTFGGAPRAAIANAAKASVSANLPPYNVNDVTVTCPTGADANAYAVAVSLQRDGLGFFGSDGGSIAVTATAVNGQLPRGQYSVALLNKSNPNWRNNGNGCPSFNINGGITATYEGAIMVNSMCPASSGGAVVANNNAFRMNLINGAFMRIGGEYSAGTAGKINPDPMQNSQPLLDDPLAALIRPCSPTGTTNCLGNASTLPNRNTAKTGTGQCRSPNDDPCILQPGTYNGLTPACSGNTSKTYLLRPGVYFLNGGGMSLGCDARIVSIPSASTLSDAAARTAYSSSLARDQIVTRWQQDCPGPPAASTCGVMIYNAPAGSNWNVNNEAISNGSQGALLLRAYKPGSDALNNGDLFESYANVAIWQARDPAPSPTKTQPVILMRGGGCSILSGTVYASGAKVDFGGGSCGSGGSGDDTITVQFIAWDLTLGGNNNFYFAYRADAFAIPWGYGLIK